MPLFYIHWTIFASAKKNCATFFATMNEQDDQVDAGKNVKILGRWHAAGKGEGWCVVESPTYADVASFLYNWAERDYLEQVLLGTSQLEGQAGSYHQRRASDW